MSTIIYFIGAALLFAFYMWIEAHRNRIRKHQLTFQQLPESFHRYRLFFISDVHRRLIPLSMIEQLKGKADLVVIGGDLCEKGVKIERIEKNVKRLSSLGPTVFVWGNNDEEIGMSKLKSLLKKYNVEELTNKVKVINREDEHIVIAGVDDLGHHRDDIKKVIEKSEGSFSVLVSHYPTIVKKIPDTHPFLVVLSGHTHGGQIRLFGWGLERKGSLISMPNYTQLISNGYGTTFLPLRLGAPAEMHLIELCRK